MEIKNFLNMDCFKAYDIRGRVPYELNEDVAYRLGRAYAEYLKPSRVVVGRDVRITGSSLAGALCHGLMQGGCDVFDIGICGTEQVYFAVFHEELDGGIMVTASHNPRDFNGMKLVRHESRPISGDTGLNEIRKLMQIGYSSMACTTKKVFPLNIEAAYISHLLSYVDLSELKHMKIVTNAGNGSAGRVIDLLQEWLPFTFIKIHHEQDGTFPHGIPNPLLPENRKATMTAVREHQADVGLAWDGDFDRCFLFDEQGRFIEGYYIVGLLASAMLSKNPGGVIIHDPRLIWNTMDIVNRAGGVPVMSKTGHAFIKERMRIEDAVYGGEMSAHHYFRDFAYCDSGMIPWMLVLELMSRTGIPLSRLVEERMKLFPVSGEINRTIDNPETVIERVLQYYLPERPDMDFTDGLSMAFGQWRFSLRCSNTEPIVRLNVEANGDERLMRKKTREILSVMDSL